MITQHWVSLKEWFASRTPARRKKAALRKQARRFIFVGSVATTTDIVLLNVVVMLTGLPPLVANLFSMTVATIFSYIMNRRYVFSDGEKSKRKTIVPYALVTLFGVYGIQTLIFGVLTYYGEPASVAAANLISQLTGVSLSASFLLLNGAKLFAVGVAAIWNFTLYRRTVFKDR